jgi:hypothetical protein
MRLVDMVFETRTAGSGRKEEDAPIVILRT